MVEGVARDEEAAALEDALLTVERQVVGVFSDDEFGDEVEAGEPSYEWSCWRGSQQGRLPGFVFAADFDSSGDLANARRWPVIEQFGDLLSDDFKSFGVGLILVGEFDDLFHFKIAEAFDAAMIFPLGPFSFCGDGLLLSGCFVVGGGFGLFWRFEFCHEQLTLIGVKRLTAGSEEPFGKGVELLSQELVLHLKLFNFGLEPGVVVGSFDEVKLPQACSGCQPS